jgi:hypothetical protein
MSGGTNNTNPNTNNNTSNNTNTNNSTINSTSNNTYNNTNTNNSTVDQTVNQTSNSTVDQTVNSTSNNSNTNSNTNNNTNSNTNSNTNTNNTSVDSTSSNNNTNTNNSNIKQEIISPPPTAIAPTVNAGGIDTCTTSVSGAVQTQIVGIAAGTHIRDLNCERLKNSKTLYNMGMKVAAVALMCQDPGVFQAMKMAGTPCPFNGEIGPAAQVQWDANPDRTPVEKETETRRNDTAKGALLGIGGVGLLLLLL